MELVKSVMVAGGISMSESVLTVLHTDRSRRRIHRHLDEPCYIFDRVYVHRTYSLGYRPHWSWHHTLPEGTTAIC